MMVPRATCLVVAFGLSLAGSAGAGELSLQVREGRVSLVARDVTVGEILAEWARVGQVTIVNGDRVPGPPVSLQLDDVTERHALEVVLRSASGYLAAPRRDASGGNSAFDRILILPVSVAPAGSAGRQGFRGQMPAPRPFPSPGQPPESGEVDEGDVPETQGEAPFGPAPGQLRPGMQPMEYPGQPPTGAGPETQDLQPGATPFGGPTGAAPVPGQVIQPPTQPGRVGAFPAPQVIQKPGQQPPKPPQVP
jgi:hypothetical protein